MTRRSRLATLAAALVLLAGGAAAFFARQPGPPQVMKAGAFDPPHAAPGFSLQGSDGSAVTLARYRGKVVLLTFGFTYCAAVCPTTLATLAQVRSRLGKAADQVQVVFVTVDPARDDAAQLRDYLAAFDRSFIGATDTPDALAAVRRDYGVKAVKQGAGTDYAIAHTSSIFLIDRSGRLRALMPFGRGPDDFVHDIRLLLA
ncbi:MAG: SCO family protein [Pseudomonadota bacterium]